MAADAAAASARVKKRRAGIVGVCLATAGSGLIDAELERLKELVVLLHNGDLSGYSGKWITDVANLGAGGSHLGPRTAIEALRAQWMGDVAVHFVSMWMEPSSRMCWPAWMPDPQFLSSHPRHSPPVRR
ncbi:hypothetical protein FDY93_01450 [Microbulbifer harenosus]|uniref:Uncharacterized protein n=1 Tax=Microbulbifer harenosus TaxID=2576840 RepID=A0ABY2UM66_9GAMM|nr:hypothetical protein FDY93_01450 [Microbulbifer harenosus]